MATSIAIPGMLLVSRQFRSEYQDTLKFSGLHLFDKCSGVILGPGLSQDVYTHFCRASIYLLMFAPHDLDNHIACIWGLEYHLRRLLRLHVTIFICTPVHLLPYEPVLWPRDFNFTGILDSSHTLLNRVAGLLEIRAITSVEVRFAQPMLNIHMRNASIDPEYRNASDLYGRWSRTDGWTGAGASEKV